MLLLLLELRSPLIPAKEDFLAGGSFGVFACSDVGGEEDDDEDESDHVKEEFDLGDDRSSVAKPVLCLVLLTWSAW
jgi:hypothetical protein